MNPEGHSTLTWFEKTFVGFIMADCVGLIVAI